MLLTSRNDGQLSDAQELREMFRLIDKDDSGSIETNVSSCGFLRRPPPATVALCSLCAMISVADVL